MNYLPIVDMDNQHTYLYKPFKISKVLLLCNKGSNYNFYSPKIEMYIIARVHYLESVTYIGQALVVCKRKSSSIVEENKHFTQFSSYNYLLCSINSAVV